MNYNIYFNESWKSKNEYPIFSQDKKDTNSWHHRIAIAWENIRVNKKGWEADIKKSEKNWNTAVKVLLAAAIIFTVLAFCTPNPFSSIFLVAGVVCVFGTLIAGIGSATQTGKIAELAIFYAKLSETLKFLINNRNNPDLTKITEPVTFERILELQDEQSDARLAKATREILKVEEEVEESDGELNNDDIESQLV